MKLYCKECNDQYKHCRVVGCPFLIPAKTNLTGNALGWWETQRRWIMFVCESNGKSKLLKISLTPRSAIKAFCLYRCQSGCKEAIRSCIQTDCLLFRFRPYKRKEEKKRPTQEATAKSDISAQGQI